MKRFRILAVCTLFLLAAVPTFALPLCEDCNEFTGECDSTSFEHLPCRYTLTGCEQYFKNCSGFTAADAATTTVLSEWTVASIEVTNEQTATVAAPSAIAQADTPQTVLQK